MSDQCFEARDGEEPLTCGWDESVDGMELRFTLRNDPSFIRPLATYLSQRATAFGLCDGTLERHVGIALEEALLNAVYHGNLELSAQELLPMNQGRPGPEQTIVILRRQRTDPYRDRRVFVVARLSSKEAEFIIRDEGPGFDYAVCTPLVIDDGELTRPSGRGLLLMYSFMDEVRFNALGNEVTMVLRADRDREDTELDEILD